MGSRQSVWCGDIPREAFAILPGDHNASVGSLKVDFLFVVDLTDTTTFDVVELSGKKEMGQTFTVHWHFMGVGQLLPSYR